jgi:hypothetical protein
MNRTVEALFQDLGQLMNRSIPGGWKRADLEARMEEGYAEIQGRYFADADGPQQSFEVTFQTIRTLYDLRREMARSSPEKVAWHTIHFTLYPDGKFNVAFEYDGDPKFTISPQGRGSGY